jgi:hypothetical protein
MAFSKSGFGALVGGKAVHQCPKNYFFPPPMGGDSNIDLAGLLNFEKAMEHPDRLEVLLSILK